MTKRALALAVAALVAFVGVGDPALAAAFRDSAKLFHGVLQSAKIGPFVSTTAPPFSPPGTPRVWWDPTDAATVTSSAGRLDSISSKGSQPVTLSQSGAARPGLTTINGHTAIYYDSTATWMTDLTHGMQDVFGTYQPYILTWVCVVQPKSALGVETWTIMSDDTDTWNDWSLYSSDGVDLRVAWTAFARTQLTASSGQSMTSAFVLGYRARSDPPGPGSQVHWTVWVNGVVVGDVVNTQVAGVGTYHPRVSNPQALNGGLPGTGKIRDLAIGDCLSWGSSESPATQHPADEENAALSDANMLQVSTDLMTKWGIP